MTGTVEREMTRRMNLRKPIPALGVALALLLIVATLIPTATTDLTPAPAPVSSYAAAVALVAKRQRGDDTLAVPEGRTVLLTHGRRSARVVVLFHGFTNSPRQYEHLAAQLFASGDNVYIPRLPLHAVWGSRVGALASLTAEQLRQAADSAVDVATGLGDTIVVAGVSAGGTIAAWIAQNRGEVRRAVLIAPLFEVGRVPRFIDRPLVNVALHLPNVTRSDAPDTLRPDRELGVSSRAVAQVIRLGLAVRRRADDNAPRVREVAFVTNASDHTVLRHPIDDLARRWSGEGARVT